MHNNVFTIQAVPKALFRKTWTYRYHCPGESLKVAATAVTGQVQTSDLLYVGGLSVIITCLLWWSFFAWISEHLEEYFSIRK